MISCLHAATAASVRRMWRPFADRMGDDDAFRRGHIPRITLAVLPDAIRVREIEEAVFGAVDVRKAFPLVPAG